MEQQIISKKYNRLFEKMIKPIIQSSMKDNNVAQYFDMANSFINQVQNHY